MIVREELLPVDWSTEWSGDAGTGAVGLGCCKRNWSAVSLAGNCVIVSEYLKSLTTLRGPEVIFGRFTEIALKKAIDDFHNLVLIRTVSESCCDWSIPGIGCAEFAAVIGWIMRRLLTGRRRAGKGSATTSGKKFV